MSRRPTSTLNFINDQRVHNKNLAFRALFPFFQYPVTITNMDELFAKLALQTASTVTRIAINHATNAALVSYFDH